MLAALGFNHHSAPLAVRERIAFSIDDLGEALVRLTHKRPVREAAILSTCNRTEIYCASGCQPDEMLSWLAEERAMGVDELRRYAYALSDAQAVRHVFRVASGLDSMVLGEPQILGQMKCAARAAESAGTLGTLLHKLFEKTFAVAKEVRSSTAVGANVVSMAAAAVRLSEQIFESVRQQHVLFVGAGEMIALCIAHFAGHAPRSLTIANRTPQRAQALASRFGAKVLPIEDLGMQLDRFDIVVTSTASPLPIIGLGSVERALKARRRRPMVIVDLAVPRDVEEEVSRLDDGFLYTLDDLAEIVSEGLATRQAAVVEAEAMIDHRVDHFLHWIESRSVVPTIRAICEQAASWREQELGRALTRLRHGHAAEEVLRQFGTALSNKLLHGGLQTLNEAGANEQAQLVELYRKIYRLP